MEFTIKIRVENLSEDPLELMARILDKTNGFITGVEEEGCDVELTIHETTYLTPSSSESEE